ncbi:phospholipase A(2) isoform X1 [Euwallacea fornicatus]|uniref:phospholipase A(2) isoform X1 n=1 Tax=Euwallacea fornicatus TaxID=995702 RepID=UPI00338FAC18
MGSHILVKICHILTCVALVLGSTVLIADNSMSRMIELTTKIPYCNVHTDRGNIRTMLLAADAARVRQMSDDSIRNLEEVCNDKEKLMQQQGGFIYPGTKWCGPGNIGSNYSDLGRYAKEDACCREHDNCPKSLMKEECRGGICNNSPYTRSHCDCDAIFRKCLQNVNSETANTIGAIFFNVIQVICFKERSPCSEWQKNSNYLREGKRVETSTSNCSLEFVASDKYNPSNVNNGTKNAQTWNFFRKKKTLLLNLFLRKLQLFIYKF